MTHKLIKIIFFNFLCSFTFAASASALAIPEERFPDMELEELESELKSAKYFDDLSEASAFINAENQCGVHIRTAREALEEMRRIKAATVAAGRTTQQNADNHSKFQSENQVALFDYKSCFTRLLVNYPTLLEVGISTYEAHKVVFDANKGDYSNVPNLDNYIVAIQNAIENKEKNDEGDFAAQLSNVHKTVEVLQGGRGTTWKKVAQGYKLRITDEIRTGPEGRTRILFADRFNGTNAGPTVVNMGSSAHIRIEHFLATFGNDPSRQGIIGLLRGKLRVFTDIFGPRSSFKVRTVTTIANSGGTAISIGGDTQIGMDGNLGVIIKISRFLQNMFTANAQNTGIFGTEIAVEYNPDSDIFTAHLDRGTASIEHNGENIALAPKTSRTVAFGNISPARPLSDNIWGLVVADTGEGYVETAATAQIELTDDTAITPVLTSAETQAFREERRATYLQFSQDLVSKFYGSMNSYDEFYYTFAIAGEADNFYRESSQGRTFSQFINTKTGRPRTWSNMCGICLSDESNTCIIKTFVEYESNNHKETVLIWLNEQNNDVFDRKIVKIRRAVGDDLKFFETLNPKCNENF